MHNIASGIMWEMGFVGLLVVIILLLTAAALVKYLVSRNAERDR